MRGVRPQGQGTTSAGTTELAAVLVAEAGTDAKLLGLPEGRDLLNTIRSKTMKRGGVGYVQPDKGSFPLMADTNRFILAPAACRCTRGSTAPATANKPSKSCSMSR